MAVKRSLALYLQGHFAGSEAAVRSVKEQATSDPGTDLGRFLGRLAEEIAEDQASLRDVMARLATAPSRTKNLAALLSATVGRWTLRAHAPGEPQAGLIGLESLSLGIEGKAGLWRALREVAAIDPRLGDVDFDELIKRAQLQREQLEPHRLDAARQANGNGRAHVDG